MIGETMSKSMGCHYVVTIWVNNEEGYTWPRSAEMGFLCEAEALEYARRYNESDQGYASKPVLKLLPPLPEPHNHGWPLKVSRFPIMVY